MFVSWSAHCVCELYVCTSDTSAVGESQGRVMEVSMSPIRHLQGEEGLYPPEPERLSLHDSEGLLA